MVGEPRSTCAGGPHGNKLHAASSVGAFVASRRRRFGAWVPCVLTLDADSMDIQSTSIWHTSIRVPTRTQQGHRRGLVVRGNFLVQTQPSRSYMFPLTYRCMTSPLAPEDQSTLHEL